MATTSGLSSKELMELINQYNGNGLTGLQNYATGATTYTTQYYANGSLGYINYGKAGVYGTVSTTTTPPNVPYPAEVTVTRQRPVTPKVLLAHCDSLLNAIKKLKAV